MFEPLPIPPLGLTEAQAEARFATLQEKLVPLWRSILLLRQPRARLIYLTSQELHRRTIERLDREASAALAGQPLPEL